MPTPCSPTSTPSGPATATKTLVFTLQNLGIFRGRISGDRWTFTGGSPAGTFYINGKPDTASVLLGAGLLADGSGNPTNVGTQLQIRPKSAPP